VCVRVDYRACELRRMTAAAPLNDSLLAVTSPDSDNCSFTDTGQSVLLTSQDVMFSGLSIIIPAGLILNALSLVVLMSRPMRRRASSWYLAALAASDNLSLVAVSFDYWLKDSRIGLQVLETLLHCFIVHTVVNDAFVPPSQ